MFSLRQKLSMGFGGLLAILLIVSGLGVVVLSRYSTAVDSFLYENFRSVQYGQNMKDAVERLSDAVDDANRGSLAGAKAAAAPAIADFTKNLADEDQNVTLHPREDELDRSLHSHWQQFQPLLATILDDATPAAARSSSAAHAASLATTLRQDAAEIVQINLNNMVVANGQVKTEAVNTRRLMLAFSLAGIVLAAMFTTVVGRLILRPVRALTNSAREIERGNLDLVVAARGRDELGQLAEAFNSMAAKLREFRRTDRAKLVRTQETTRNAINSLPDAVAILSADGVVEMTNASAQKLFGLTANARVADGRSNWLKDLYERVARERRPIEPRGYESAIQVLDEGGGERFFLPQAVPIFDDAPGAGRSLIGVTVVLADVTNLRRLDEMKSGMLSVVSHELKTPLTSIRMGVHLVLEERIGPLTPQQNDLLVAVRDDAERLNRIVENLLDMGRIESGRAMMDLRPTPAREIVAEATDAQAAAYHDRGVTLSVDVPAGMPDVLADTGRIGHVFSNLLSNALRYTPPGGRVTVSAESDGNGQVRFTVADTGAGIAADQLARVFDRFYRAPGQPANTGAGLGLAIAKEIVDAHGGDIAVQSHEGQGSAFTFSLCRAAGADTA